MTRSFLEWTATFVTLATTAIAARKPATQWRGVLLGLAVGTTVGVALFAGVRFLSYVMPLHQIDFWLAARFARIWP